MFPMPIKDLKALVARTNTRKMGEREKQLKRLILKGDFESERELADLIWPYDRVCMEYLRHTKNSFFQHIERVVYDQSTEPGARKNFIDCWKSYLTIKILQASWQRKEMLYFAERLLKKAKRYEVNVEVVDTDDML